MEQKDEESLAKCAVPRQMEWLTWQGIKGDRLLNEDAGVIVDELEKHLNAVPLQPHA
jgi:hypothetical protein